jgi:hypothetical protein
MKSLAVHQQSPKGLIMSTNLAQVLESLKNEIKVDSNGRGFVTIRGAARLAGVNNMALTRAFSPDDFLTSKLAQSLTNKGFSVETFSSQGIPDKALACILEYYTFDAGKRCTEIAELTYRTFATIGVRSWLHKSVGYVETVQTEDGKIKNVNRVLDAEEKLEKVFTDLLKYCKGEPRTTGFFGSGHSFVRRKDVLELFGKRGQRYLNKPQIIRLFRSAEAAGLGSLNVDRKEIYTFTPFNSQPLLTA